LKKNRVGENGTVGGLERSEKKSLTQLGSDTGTNPWMGKGKKGTYYIISPLKGQKREKKKTSRAHDVHRVGLSW